MYSNALSEVPAVVTSLFEPTVLNTTALGISPNPNSGTFRLGFSSLSAQISEIVISDYAGNVKDRFTSKQELYIVNYTPGMYIVQVKTTDDALYVQKMIIE